MVSRSAGRRSGIGNPHRMSIQRPVDQTGAFTHRYGGARLPRFPIEGQKHEHPLENLCARTVVAPARNPANPSQRILMVEDDLLIRHINAQVLIRSGYQVDGAGDGVAGWEALHAAISIS